MNLGKQWISHVLLVLFIAGCTATNVQPSATLQGRVLLWHAWTGEEATALATVLSRFQEIHPAAVVKEQAFATPAELLTQFRIAADAGLGPDLILAPSQWLRPLREAALIDAVTVTVDAATVERYWPAATTALRDQGDLYGLPVALETMVLYYDRRQVEQPPATLAELLAAAAEGQLVEMGTSFFDAFWGVAAFGGRLLDREQQVILDRGGFAEWLAWLKTARATPGMILETNRTSLLNRFVEGNIAYYVGSSSEYSTILVGRTDETTGIVRMDEIGVAPLPTGPKGNAAPFLQVQAFLFSTVSSNNQRRLALEVAYFVTNAEQQTTLMRAARLIPANRRVRVNARLEPVSATFVTQAAAALSLPNVAQIDEIFRLGNDAYAQVLEGVLDPVTAAANLSAAINDAGGVTVVDPGGMACPAQTQLTAACPPGREETSLESGK